MVVLLLLLLLLLLRHRKKEIEREIKEKEVGTEYPFDLFLKIDQHHRKSFECKIRCMALHVEPFLFMTVKTPTKLYVAFFI